MSFDEARDRAPETKGEMTAEDARVAEAEVEEAVNDADGPLDAIKDAVTGAKDTVTKKGDAR